MSESTQYWGAEGILSGVMKLMSLLLAHSEEYGNMLSQENLEFQPIWDCILGNFASDKCINHLRILYQIQLATNSMC